MICPCRSRPPSSAARARRHHLLLCGEGRGGQRHGGHAPSRRTIPQPSFFGGAGLCHLLPAESATPQMHAGDPAARCCHCVPPRTLPSGQPGPRARRPHLISARRPPPMSHPHPLALHPGACLPGHWPPAPLQLPGRLRRARLPGLAPPFEPARRRNESPPQEVLCALAPPTRPCWRARPPAAAAASPPSAGSTRRLRTALMMWHKQCSWACLPKTKPVSPQKHAAGHELTHYNNAALLCTGMAMSRVGGGPSRQPCYVDTVR